MPAPINNTYPNGQQGSAQTGPKQTGVGSNPFADIFKGFQGTAELKDIADLLQKIAGLLAKQEADVQRTTRGLKDYGNELRQNLQFAQDIENSTKRLSTVQKKIARDALKVRDLTGVKKILKEMEELNRKQAERGIWSPRQTKVLRNNAREIEAALKQVGSMNKNAFTTEHIQKMQKMIGRVSKDSVNLTRTMRGVRLTSSTNDIGHANQALRHLFQAKGDASENIRKIRRYAVIGTQIRDAHKERVAGHHSNFIEKRKSIMRKADTAIGQKKYSTFVDAYGRVDRAGVEKERIRLADPIRAEARAQGMGRLASHFLADDHAKKRMGQKNGFLTDAALNVMARGEGSLGHGLVSMASGVITDGAGSLAELAGPAAAPLAVAGIVASIVKKFFNANQVRNAEVADHLGGSGIYGSKGPIKSIENVRNNLTGPLYSNLGIGYQKNMQIAQALAQAGFSNQNLGSGVLAERGDGTLAGSFGTMQRNVYAYGRMAGLDTNQTMEQTLKLITQYKMSLGSTEDFFVQINKDVRSAGLSSMKWLQLLDDANSHYERSNKMLEATVDTMRLLSATGKNTADDIKEAMDAATSGGSKRSLEVKTFLGMQMFKDPQAVAREQGMNDLNVSDKVDSVVKALNPDGTDPRYTKDAITAQIKSTGMDTISDLMSAAQDKTKDSNGNVDTTALQAARGAITGLQTALQKQQNFSAYSKLDPMRAALAYGTSTQTTGEDLLSQKMFTIQSIRTAMQASGIKMSDYMDQSKRPAVDANLKYQQLLGVFGTDPTKVNTLMNSVIGDSADARIQIAQKGLRQMSPKHFNSMSKSDQAAFTKDNESRKALLEESYEILKRHGAVGLGNTGDRIKDIQAYANGVGKSEMRKIFLKDESSLNDISGNATLNQALRETVNQRDLDEQVHQATGLAADTRTTADIWAQAFEYLFNWLKVPLDFIAEIIKHVPTVHMSDTASDKQLKNLENLVGGGGAQASLSAYDKKIAELQAILKKPGAGVDVGQMQADLSDAQQKRAAIAAAVQAEHDPQAKKFLLGSQTDEWQRDSSLRPFANAEESFKALSDAGAKIVGQTATLTDDQYNAFYGKLSRLSAGMQEGWIKDEKGKVTGHTITNIYNSTSVSTQSADKGQSLRTAGENPSVTN